MEWSWRTVLILIGLLGMAAILVDGFRRMQRNRAEALKLDVGPVADVTEEDEYNPELPGKVRVVKPADDSYNSRFRDAQPIRPKVSAEEAVSQKEAVPHKNAVSPKETTQQKASFSQAENIDAATVSEVAAPEDTAAVASSVTPPVADVEDEDDLDLQPMRAAQDDDDIEPDSLSTDTEMPVIPQSPLIPTPKPVNLDEKVPVLLDVEELGDEESFAEGIISAPRVVSNADAARVPAPEKNTTPAADQSTARVEDKNEDDSADDELPVVEDPETINDPHLEQELEDLPPDETDTPYNVIYAGPGAEVLARRPEPELVLVIHTIARNPEGFRGEDLLMLFNSCDLRYGEKDIFHRFEEAGGEGCIQFSVAQMRNPGVFNPATMADESFSGLSFFMSLPGPARPLEAYEAMSEMAMAVSRNLKADVLDGSHSAMTPQTMEHERQQILDFERQRRLAAKKKKL